MPEQEFAWSARRVPDCARFFVMRITRGGKGLPLARAARGGAQPRSQ
jgi:hypothetical protein